MQPVVEHADAQEHRASHEAVRHHLHHRTLHAGLVEHEETQRDEAHVGDRRIGHQFLHVGLHQRHQANVDDGHQRQRDHQPGQLMAGVRRDGQRQTQEGIGPQLQHDGGQHHRAPGGRLDVGVGQPGVHRPHRDLDRKGQQEGHEDQHLLMQRERQPMPGQDLEAARLQIQVDDRHHREQRSQQGIEEELEGRIHAVRAAPHPDDDVHRDQRRLEEHVEQHAVGGREHPDHQAGEDQEGPQVLMDTVLDDFPAGDDHHEGDEGRQQHQPHRQAVDAE